MSLLSKLNSFKMKQPLILLGIVLFCFFAGHLVPVEIKSFLYSVALTIKDVLLGVLPFIIFSYLFNSMYEMKGGAIQFVILLLGLVCFSNILSVWASYPISALVLGKGAISLDISCSDVPLEPLWDLHIPLLSDKNHFIVDFVLQYKNMIALFFGFTGGILGSLAGYEPGQKFGQQCVKASDFVLKRLFMPVLPLFIFGFAIKLQHDEILEPMFKNSLFIFVFILICQFTYVLFMYALAAGFRPKKFLGYLQNMIPALITGFTTSSSVASMPQVLDGTKKNLKDPKIAEGIIPATTNIHLVGDSFSIPILVMALMMAFGHGFPSMTDYLVFSGLFALMKFSTAGVPGGTALVMLGIFEKSMGFTPDMLSLITAMYIMFDPINTPANVLGNGAFPILFEKIYDRVRACCSRGAPSLS